MTGEKRKHRSALRALKNKTKSNKSEGSDYNPSLEMSNGEDEDFIDYEEENSKKYLKIFEESIAASTGNIQSQVGDKLTPKQARVAKQYKCKYEDCHENFKSDRKRYIHYKKVHGYLGAHVCSECEISFYTNFLLSKHIEKVHNDANDSHLCNVCGKTFDQRRKMKDHYRAVHLKKHLEQAICDQCGKGFQSEAVLKNHISDIHLGLKRYKCLSCGKCYPRGTTLKEHIEVTHFDHENKINICEFCGLTFSTNNETVFQIIKRRKKLSNANTAKTDLLLKIIEISIQQNFIIRLIVSSVRFVGKKPKPRDF